jgi:hypothetical protein
MIALGSYCISVFGSNQLLHTGDGAGFGAHLGEGNFDFGL